MADTAQPPDGATVAADSFANLTALHTKVDAKFADIAARHPDQVHCRRGCHSCCLPGLTVVGVEAARIRQYFVDHPDALAAARATARDKPHGTTRCAMLDRDGACIIYPVRPTLCRAHGVPALVARRDGVDLDVCPLNFTDIKLNALTYDRIGIDQLNTLLFLTGELWQAGTSRKRVRLTLRGLGIQAKT